MSLLKLTQQGWDAVFHPTVRLSADFPLTGKRLGSAYLRATACFFAGSLLPLLPFLGFVFFGIKYFSPTTLRPVLEVLFTRSGELTTNALVALCVVSFACGFGFEMWYLRRHLAKQGYKLSQVVGFSLAPLKGKSWIATVWALLWRVGLAYGAWYCFEHLLALFLTGPEQPTVELVRKLSGGNLWVFFVLAAVVAPILEETVFRGFLFQALRATFRRQKPEVDGSSSGGMGSGCAFFAGLLLPAAVLSISHLIGNPGVIPAALKPALILSGIGIVEGLLLQALYLRRCASRQGKQSPSLAQCMTGTLEHLSLGKCAGACLLRLSAAVFALTGMTLGRSILQSGDLLWLKQLVDTHVWVWILAPIAFLALSELVVNGLLSRLAHSAYGRVLRFTSKSAARADLLAVLISGAIFSLEHLQFQPVTMLMLMLMGCYLAEIYRRTGTLWCGILLHGLNNGLAVVLLTLAK